MPVTPCVYLSSLGPGCGPAGGDVGGVEAHDVGRRQVEADVDELDAAALPQRVNGFEAAECHGQRGVHGRAADRPGSHVEAAGDVDGHHRDAGRVDGAEHLGRGGSQWAGAGDADDAVDHQIGCGRDALHDAPAGLPEGGSAPSCGCARD